MATEVIISFGLKKLQDAKQAAKDILQSIKQASKSIKDVGERKAFVAFAKKAAKDKIAGIDADLASQAKIDKLTKARRGDLAADIGLMQPIIDKAAQGAVSKVLGIGQKLGQLGGGVAGLLTQDDPSGTKGLQLGLHTMAASGIPIASQIAAVVSQVLSVVEAQEEKRRAALEKIISEGIDRRLRDADTARKYREDANYQRKLDREAQSLYVAQVKEGWQPRGSRLNDGDF